MIIKVKKVPKKPLANVCRLNTFQFCFFGREMLFQRPPLSNHPRSHRKKPRSKRGYQFSIQRQILHTVYDFYHFCCTVLLFHSWPVPYPKEMNYTPFCGTPYTDEDRLLENLKFYGPGVSVTIIGGIGLVGNVLSIIAISTFPSSKLTLFYKVRTIFC